jgi:hypothetical protein
LYASFGRTRFKETENPNDSERFQSYQVNGQMRIGPRSNVTMRGFLNKNKGASNSTRNRGLHVTYTLHYNIYVTEIKYTLTDEKDYISDESLKNNLIMVTINRRLF